MLYEFGGFNLKDAFAPVWERAAPSGLRARLDGRVPGAGKQRHARGPRRQAAGAARRRRQCAAPTASPATSRATLGRLWEKIARAPARSGAFISGATGAEPATAEERAFLEAHPELAVRATGTHIGHGVEPQFAMNIALAAIAVQRGTLFAAHEPTGVRARPVGRAR